MKMKTQKKKTELTYKRMLHLMNKNQLRTNETIEKSSAEVDEKFNEVSERFKETDAKFKETDLKFKETDAKFKETDLVFKETALRFKELDLFLKELGKQIGGIGNKFGTFNEGLVLPSLTRLLTDDFNCKSIFPNFKHRENGTILEIDLLGVSNIAYYIIEIKSHLREDSIEQLKLEIEQFKLFKPLFEEKQIYGLITATHYDKKIKERVLKDGIYFISITDDIVKMDIPENFIPRAW